MGNRPTSKIIYGFVYVHDWESDDDEPDFDYDKEQAWEDRCAELEGATTLQEKEAALRKHGQYVDWGFLDDASHAFGFVFASGDWEDAEMIDPSMFVPPDDAEEKLAALCEFYGVKSETPKWMMLTASW